MKIKLLLLASVLCFAGCKDSEGPDCSLVSCAPFQATVNVKYVDKNTNAPLLGTSNAAYKLADLKVTRADNSINTPEPKVSETDNSVITVTDVLNGTLLTLGNLSADKVTITTKASKTQCCSIDITSLKINDVTICAPCTDLNTRVIVIKK
jgi:hypothetical protein